jgi:hypothetical protein
MSATASIVVLIAAGHLGAPAMASLRSAIEQTLGSSSSITIEVTDDIPVDIDAELFFDMLGITALAEVTWQQPQVDTATVRVFARTRAIWVDRRVHFVAADEDAERGRTLGYALSALVPEPAEPARAPAAAEPPKPSAPLYRDVPPTPRLPAPTGSELAIDGAAAITRVSGVDLLGGAVALRASARSGFGVHAELGARAGYLQAADARLIDLRLALGPTRSWWFDRITTAVTLNAVVLRETIAMGGEERSRFIPGGALSLQLAWHAFGPCWLGTSLGAEVVTGTTRVMVRGERTLSLSPVRVLAALTFGVRL